MGYIRHHAIVVTTSFSDVLQEARARALLTGCLVTPVVEGHANGYATFCVVPDGSKEGWETSLNGDEARDAFVEWLRAQQWEFGDPKLEWAEVWYGHDDGVAQITRHAWALSVNE